MYPLSYVFVCMVKTPYQLIYIYQLEVKRTNILKQVKLILPLYVQGRVDLIRCYMCGIGLKDWSADDEPLFEHVRHSPDCPFLFTFLGQDVLDAYKVCFMLEIIFL